jgi:hypothetical protein
VKTFGESILRTTFGILHHPSSANEAETFVYSYASLNRTEYTTFTNQNDTTKDFSINRPMGPCERIYLLRAATREDQSNKCVGIMNVIPEFFNPLDNNNRVGTIYWPQVFLYFSFTTSFIPRNLIFYFK